jgi:hypothetical protein
MVQAVIKGNQNCAIQNSHLFSVGTYHFSQKQTSCAPQHKRCVSHYLKQQEQHCNSETAFLGGCAMSWQSLDQ